jgi:hypothetical protein
MIVVSGNIVAGSARHATKHYFVRGNRDFSNNKDSNDSYLEEADMNS